jgi:hypothetical protein
MDPLNKHLKSILPTVDDNGTIDINLHNLELIALIECLNFAHSAAKVLNEVELKKGTTASAKKMVRIQNDSRELAKILEEHLHIGQPESKEIN